MISAIHHLNCGTMCPFCQRLLEGEGSLFKSAEMVCHCLLVETAAGMVLVDTGLGRYDIENPKHLGATFRAVLRPRLDSAETAHAQIQALGFEPSAIAHIVPTHLDLDHAGGLSDFPEANVHVYAPELKAALNPSFLQKSRYKAAQFRHQPKWVQHHLTDRQWFGFEALAPIEALKDDLLLVPLLGHTHGHVGVALRFKDKWLLHAGDAYFHRNTLKSKCGAPRALRSFENVMQTSRRKRLESQARLRALHQQHGHEVDIFCAHDPVEFARYKA